MQRSSHDIYSSWLLGEILLVALLASATALFLTNPQLQDAYVLPEVRLVLDTAIALAGGIVAILAGVRFGVEGRRLDLFLCGGFTAAAGGTLIFAVVPMLGGAPLRPSEAWAGLTARVFAAALIAAAPFVRGRAAVRGRALLLAVGGLVPVLAFIWLVFLTIGTELPLLGPAPGSSQPFVLTGTLSLLALLWVIALIGFGMRYRAHREDLDSWIALAATAALFAELHYVLTPQISSEYVLNGDFLRVVAYAVLLVGVWRAISFAEFGRAVAEERARVAREIHDGLAQYLFAISTHTSMLESGAPLDELLPRLKEAAAAAQQEARFAVLALSSASGTAPFDAALRRYVEFLTADGALEVDVEINRSVQLAPDEQIEVFRIVQEGLANVRKHAGARRAEVRIVQRGSQRVVLVRDDGAGFDGEELAAGQGLKNMRQRSEAIDGAFALRSTPGMGTLLEVTLRAC